MDYATAVDAIRRLAVQYQAMVDAADLMEQIGSVDQATKQFAAAKAKAEAELAQVKSDLAKAQKDYSVVKEDSEFNVKQAGDRAQEIITSANNEAFQITQAAKSKADQIIKDGHDQANATVASIASKVDDMKSELDRLSKEADAANQKRDAALKAAEETELRLQSVQQTIRKMAQG